MKAKTAKISDLSAMPNPDVYRRADGNLYLKLNERFHVKTKIEADRWVGDGCAEKFDKNEIVTRLT